MSLIKKFIMLHGIPKNLFCHMANMTWFDQNILRTYDTWRRERKVCQFIFSPQKVCFFFTSFNTKRENLSLPSPNLCATKNIRCSDCESLRHIPARFLFSKRCDFPRVTQRDSVILLCYPWIRFAKSLHRRHRLLRVSRWRQRWTINPKLLFQNP